MNSGWSCVIIVLAVATLLAGCSGNTSRGASVSETQARERKLGLYDKHFGVRTSECQNHVLEGMVRDVLIASDQRRVDLLGKNIVVLTNRFGCMSSGQWESPSLEQALVRVFEDSSFRTNGVYRFSSGEELDGFLQFHLEAAVFLGQLRLHSRGYGYEASQVEGLVLRSLKTYRDHYVKINRPDLREVVCRHLEHWLHLIESEDGVARLAARRLLAYELERVKIIGDITHEDAVRAARSHAQGLIQCGYTPRWLDAEFPLPSASGM